MLTIDLQGLSYCSMILSISHITMWVEWLLLGISLTTSGIYWCMLGFIDIVRNQTAGLCVFQVLIMPRVKKKNS